MTKKEIQFLEGPQSRWADFGIGIPQEDLDKVFTRFYRVRGLASTFSGSGIGLYISAEIIKRHGGNLWVESELGKGSKFYFNIEAAKAPRKMALENISFSE